MKIILNSKNEMNLWHIPLVSWSKTTTIFLYFDRKLFHVLTLTWKLKIWNTSHTVSIRPFAFEVSSVWDFAFLSFSLKIGTVFERQKMYWKYCRNFNYNSLSLKYEQLFLFTILTFFMSSCCLKKIVLLQFYFILPSFDSKSFDFNFE